MRFTVHLLRTPVQGHPVTRAVVSLEAPDMLLAAYRATELVEEIHLGSDGDWWAIAALPRDTQQPDKTVASDV